MTDKKSEAKSLADMLSGTLSEKTDKKSETKSLADVLRETLSEKTNPNALNVLISAREHVLGDRKSDKRTIRFENTSQMDVIQMVVDYLNMTGEVGQRASFNSFVVDAALKEAKRILKKSTLASPPSLTS